jgi:hypothetical protein
LLTIHCTIVQGEQDPVGWEWRKKNLTKPLGKLKNKCGKWMKMDENGPCMADLPIKMVISLHLS